MAWSLQVQSLSEPTERFCICFWLMHTLDNPPMSNGEVTLNSSHKLPINIDGLKKKIAKFGIVEVRDIQKLLQS